MSEVLEKASKAKKAGIVKKPLVKAMEKYIKGEKLRLHMPGHKGKLPAKGMGATWGAVWQADLTEVGGLDDLHAPSGVIGESQQLLADLYRSKKAHFLVNGATVGLQAAILASCGEGDKIIVPRNAHKSIWNAIALSGATPVWLPVYYHAELGISLGVALETVEQAILENLDAKAILFTYPTYHGFCGDLKKMARLAGQRGIFTIVDEAHGAHFAFTGWPDMAVDSGAAIVVQGWHKTMGSLTQTGVMLQNDDTYPVEKYLAMLQSSSPSYILMASLDEARANWEANRDRLAAKMLKTAQDVRNAIGELALLDCLNANNIPWPVADYDSTRIVIFSGVGHNGWQIAAALAKAGVEVEMADSGTVTLIITPADTSEDVKKLKAALAEASANLEKVKAKKLTFVNFGDLPQMAMTPKAALAKDCQWVDLAAAQGRVAADLLVPYPPGIPVVGMGEVISDSIIAGIEYILEEGGRVQGVVDGKVSVVL